MLNKVCPRKDLYDFGEKHDGFFIDGTNFDDCYKQLIQYGKEHPEKWIYYYDCGTNVGYPVPVATYILEVTVLDREPAGIMISRLFQKGCDGRREIDEMTVDKAGYDPIPEVAAHWKSIVDGKVSFGYEVWND